MITGEALSHPLPLTAHPWSEGHTSSTYEEHKQAPDLYDGAASHLRLTYPSVLFKYLLRSDTRGIPMEKKTFSLYGFTQQSRHVTKA